MIYIYIAAPIDCESVCGSQNFLRFKIFVNKSISIPTALIKNFRTQTYDFITHTKS